ncbi:2,5-diketo-D-gluconic acid reductase A [Streptococcus pneumoniae]|uniref:2,5-diketo-D-gluconic acid reductase A n=2 Tax=Streptococcus pneumoniae TaxID=1313 RepID=A0A4L8D512_STREE|nr:aldo/keto reductase [Streptococcus pneumoniae]MDS2909412.1 aldo/keto reductase [Streptococcus pneumoniae]VFI27481.1 2,5-diketo-D-gluconic acid reductase A [Streptococcus pneumoniae]VIT40039.1 2,5-diketo-D-gluconic acid reductase A [Streptococcus pneumoniae]VJF56034.1 2,5-diketo-D-gluconic acid reductase A [Streptococcus pneumoniae]VJI21012.1 2,5-diketo-D-gluconic acid reductase A [Streptococcus pneumoniae]
MNTYQLNNGVEIPVLGFGTFKAMDGEEAYRAVLEALKAGYRHIDTAAIYQNEESVGQAIKDSGVPREEMFVTTKLWNSQQTYEQTRQALEKSIEKLGLDYLDLYLIHWPNPKPLRENDAWKTRNAEVWRAMEDLYQEGKIRAIGVSNFLPHHLDALLETATIVPAVNQVRLAPGVYQDQVVAYCREKGILLEAWGPFGQGELFDSKQVQEIAANHGKSIAQIALAWSLAEGFLPLPKSVTTSRIQANLDCFGIELSHEERETLKTIAVQSGAPRVDDVDF